MARLLTIIPYRGLFPPTNGGNLRAFHLLRELATQHEVHAVILQPAAELRGEKGGYWFPEGVTVYSPGDDRASADVFDMLPGSIGGAVRARWLRRDWRSPASGLLLETHHLVRNVLRDNDIEVVLFNVLSSLALAPLVARIRPQALRIYNADNVDHILLEQELEQRPGGRSIEELARKKNIAQVRQQESQLWKHVHCFWASSEQDRSVLAALNGKRLPGDVVPNGVDTRSRHFDERTTKASSDSIIFCGSLDYLPNRDAIEWFHASIWPRIRERVPDMKLVVVGRGAPDGLRGLAGDSSVMFVGQVDDVTRYYRDSGVCVVPLRMGSGTRLKILEAMSFGNPVVATSRGAEGLEVNDGEHLLIDDTPEAFSNAVLRLASRALEFDRIRAEARRLVETKYDWSVSGARMTSIIARWLPELRKHGRLAGTANPSELSRGMGT